MNLLQRLGLREPETLEINWRNATEVYRSRKKSSLEKAEERSEELRGETQRILEELEDALEEVQEYEDSDGLNIVEDTAESFYKSRKRLLEDTSISEDPDEHHSELESFLEEFNDVSRKEGEVMKRVERSSGNLSDLLEELMSQRDEVRKFADSETALDRLKAVKQVQGELETLDSDIQKLEERLEELDIDSEQDKLENLEERLESLRGSEEAKRLEKLEEQIQQVKERRDRERASVTREASRLERCLKKIVYAVENGEKNLDGDIQRLRDIRDGKILSLDEIQPELGEAREIAEQSELLSDTETEKFVDACEALGGFQESLGEIEELEDDRERLKEEKKSMSIEEKIRKTEKEKHEKEEDIQEMETEKEDIRKEIKELENARFELARSMEQTMDAYLDAQVEIEADSR